jgi:hypothetical protein
MTTYYIDPVNGLDTNDGLGWWRLAYTAGQTAAPAPGATITGAGGATGKILSVTLSSGTWVGNNAAGYFYLYGRNGTAFANGENITWTGGSATNNQGTPYDAIYSSFKTIKKSWAAGDVINYAQCAETAQAGTVTATKGSISVSTTNDLSAACPAYSHIRINNDTTIYMVKAISSSVITLFRPYRGNTSAGYGITKLTLVTQTTGDFVPVASTGTSANHITLNGGMNPATNTQDGFSIASGGGSGYGLGGSAGGTLAYWDLYRFGFYYFDRPYNIAFSYCTINNLYAFRTTSQFSYSVNMGFFNSTINAFVSEMGKFALGSNAWAFVNSVINDLETADHTDAGLYLQSAYQTDFYRWKNAGWSGQNALYLYSLAIAGIQGARFYDAVLDERGSGCPQIVTYGSGGGSVDIIFINPMIGVGALFSSGTYGMPGFIGFENVNGVATDNRLVGSILYESGNHFNTLWSDNLNFNTAAPSAKVALNQSAYAFVRRHFIPCDAGVLKTISVYFMKNSNPISTATLNTAGSGYAVGDLISVTQAGAGSSILQVATISGSGVATFNILSGGYNYSVANALLTTTLTGAGSGCKINVTAIGTGYGSATLPIMRLHWLTGSAGSLVSNVHDVPMADTNNAWLKYSYAVTPSVKGVIIMELIFQSANAGAIAWYDDIGVA